MIQKKRKKSDLDIYMGGKVKAMRMFNGKTQSDLAEMIGVTFQQIQKYEKGVNRISMDRFIDICKFLNYSPNKILEEYCSSSAKAIKNSSGIIMNKYNRSYNLCKSFYKELSKFFGEPEESSKPLTIINNSN